MKSLFTMYNTSTFFFFFLNTTLESGTDYCWFYIDGRKTWTRLENLIILGDG